MTLGERRILSLLTSIESQLSLTQRVLAKKLGVALGTANKLVHCLAKSKMIELPQSGGRTIYRLMPLGVSEKLRLLN
ncbi:hypothetical protein MYX78_13485 [Acidobacteria bacterium AH-259-G07]|nr:hypothetical protein [Acidobacteria bacterium AH-259-G07]